MIAKATAPVTPPKNVLVRVLVLMWPRNALIPARRKDNWTNSLADAFGVMFAAGDRHDDSSREPMSTIPLFGIGERSGAGATRFQAQLIEETIEYGEFF